jgi:hypothetical protein
VTELCPAILDRRRKSRAAIKLVELRNQ